jgi:broad specificity phosphatase PhoE
MTHADNISEPWDADVARISQEMAGRLRARGVAVYDSDSPDDVLQLVEEVEEFERAVESRGGDLMVDEPPAKGAAQPDDPHFLLPTRAADESVANYMRRLRAAIAAVQEHPPQP